MYKMRRLCVQVVVESRIIDGATKMIAVMRRGAGKARFNVATPTNATVTCTAYALPYNFQTKSI